MVGGQFGGNIQNVNRANYQNPDEAGGVPDGDRMNMSRERFIAGYDHVMGGDYLPSEKKSNDDEFQRGVDTALFYIENQWTLLFNANLGDILIWLFLASKNAIMLIPCEHRECFLALVRGTRKVVLRDLYQTNAMPTVQMSLTLKR